MFLDKLLKKLKSIQTNPCLKNPSENVVALCGFIIFRVQLNICNNKIPVSN